MTSLSADARRRAGDKLARLAGRGLDLVSFWRASTEVLAGAVPHDFAPCWFTLDPASLLVTSHFDENVPELPPQWLLHESYQDDVNKLADVARSQRGTSTLHEATGGDPAGSPRWRFNMTLGGDQELVAALRTPSGEVWGRWGRTGGRGGRCSRPPSWRSSGGGAVAGGGGAAGAAGRRGHRPRGSRRARPGRALPRRGGGVGHARRGALAGRAARRRPAGRQAAVGGACGRGSGAADRRAPRPARRARGCCHGRAPGWCSTAPPWSPAAPAAWR
jgi:hypothetical protein